MIESTQIHEDHTCSICLSVFLQPVRLNKCGHIFCLSCIDEANQLAEMRKCALCRKVYREVDKISVKELKEKVEALYPHEIKKKQENLKKIIFYRLEVGNTTQVVETADDNKYQWTLFVREADGERQMKEFVESVEVELHPTFHPSKIRFKPNKPVELRRWGWGTFRIDIKVIWKK